MCIYMYIWLPSRPQGGRGCQSSCRATLDRVLHNKLSHWQAPPTPRRPGGPRRAQEGQEGPRSPRSTRKVMIIAERSVQKSSKHRIEHHKSGDYS